MADTPKMMRRPGSQVAPNQKPFFRQGTTASTHTRIPLHQATAGKRYRVRDKADADGNCLVWGEDLEHADAVKLKEQVVGSRRSKTARVEEMTEAEIAEVRAATTTSPTDAEAPTTSVSDASADTPTKTVFVDYTALKDGELLRVLGDDASKWAAAFVQHAAQQQGVELDEGYCLSWFASAIESRPRPPADIGLEQARAKSLAAAAPVARKAQVSADALKAPKAAKVVLSEPPKPPPSPLSDDVIEDGPAELPPDDPDAPAAELASGEIADLTSEVGGGPSADDAQRAREQAERDVAEMTAAAKVAYEAAVRDHAGSGPWPRWNELGDFEHAAWKFYAQNGGQMPTLVKEPRKVGFAGVTLEEQPS